MKYQKLMMIGLFLFGYGAFADGGSSVGHGGGAWVCRNQDESIRWAKMVDLYEANEEFRLGIDLKNPASVEAQLEAIKQKIKPVSRDFFWAISKGIERYQIKYVPIESNSEVDQIPDATFRIRPSKKTCIDGNLKYEQLANYTSYAKNFN